MDWKKQFDKEFTRDDGLIDKYSWYGVAGEDYPQPTPKAIKQFIQELLDKQKSEIKKVLTKKFPCEFIKGKQVLKNNFKMEFKKGHCLCDNCHLVKHILKELNK